MKLSKGFIVSMLAFLCAAFIATVAIAADNDPVTVAGILKAANCALTADQQKQIDAYDPAAGRGAGAGAGGGAGAGAAGGAGAGAGAAAGAGAGGGGGRGMGGNAALYGIFTEVQLKALAAKLGETPARGGMGGGQGAAPDAAQAAPTIRPRNLAQVIMLAKANLPLTEKQVAALKAVEMGQGGGGQAGSDIYTAQQTEALAKVMPQRGGMGGGARGGN